MFSTCIKNCIFAQRALQAAEEKLGQLQRLLQQADQRAAEAESQAHQAVEAATEAQRGAAEQAARLAAAEHAQRQLQQQVQSAGGADSWRAKYESLLLDCEKLSDRLELLQEEHEVKNV